MRPNFPASTRSAALSPYRVAEHPVARRRRAAALDVAEHRDPGLEARPLLDLPREQVADAAQSNVAELVVAAPPARRARLAGAYVSS